MAEYDRRTALLVVDIQNDFADPGGSLHVEGGHEIIPAVNAEIATAVAADADVVYSADWHPPSTPHFKKDGGIWPVHCVHDTWGGEFHPELDLEPSALVIHKGVGGEDGYSAFSVRDPRSGETWETALGHELRERMIRRLVVCGLTTDYCVVETVSDARGRALEVDVLTSAIRAVNRTPGDGDRALQRMRDVGAVLLP